MKIEELLYLPVKREGFSISTDELDCKSHYRTLDGEEVSSSFKAKSKEELLEQPKPVLKKEHAEWLEELKNEFPDNLPNQLYYVTRQGWGYGLVFESNTGQKIKISNLDGGKPKKDLVNALIYGYTVEKEKLYTVEIPNPNAKGHNKIYLCKADNTGKVYLCKGNFNPKKNKNLRLTESEIRKDFDWAWQWVEEVTE